MNLVTVLKVGVALFALIIICKEAERRKENLGL